MANQTVQTFGTTRGATEVYANSQGQETQSVYNSRGDQLVAQGLPPYAELVRMGNVYSMQTAIASAFDLVAAMPTTLATAILYNGEATGGKSYVILKAWVTSIVSTTALTPMSLLAQVLPNAGGVATAPTHSATTTLLSSNSGKASYSGLAKRAINVTTMISGYWQVLGAGTGAATASIATSVHADVGGCIIIPPGGALGLNVIAGTVATASGLIGCTWAEVQLTLG